MLGSAGGDVLVGDGDGDDAILGEGRSSRACLPRDNENGVDDAADYTVWRDTLDSTIELSADGDGSATVDAADYNIWKRNFGSTASSISNLGQNVATPEPATMVMLLAGMLAIAGRGTSRNRRPD